MERPDGFKQEKRDCVVVAISHAMAIDYATAHALCEKKGRKPGKGMVTRDALGVGPMNKVRTVLGRRVAWHKRPRATVGGFQKRNQKGSFICRVGGHAYAMVDGVLYNQSNPRDIISYYIKITFYTDGKVVDRPQAAEVEQKSAQ